MKPKNYIEQYLSECHMMQLATVANGQPWCCTVYYVHDSEYNLYWASLPTRRHSQEITHHDSVAAAIAVAFTKGEKVVGLQFAGKAELLEAGSKARTIAELYAQKFNRDTQWIDDIATGKTQHRLYQLTPATIQLFDEIHFQEVSPVSIR